MAQRKTSPVKKTGSRTSTPAPKAPGRPPVQKAPGKSIVNQKQTPWGLIITTVAVVLFAAAVVVAVIVTSGDKKSKSGGTAYTRPEIAAAKAIKGMQYHVEPKHTHVEGVLKYDTS